MSLVRARVEPSLAARVTGRSPLLYDRGADASVDRPAHVRAGSALVRLGPSMFAVVQDDASFVAILDPPRGEQPARIAVRDVPLPAPDGIRLFHDARGNKGSKLDLEACFVVENAGLLVALGSGSTTLRERVVLIENPACAEPRVLIVEARELYSALRESTNLAGSELNIEGATLSGEDIVLFQRGNGAAAGPLLPVDATARIHRESLIAYLRGLAPHEARAACPPLREIVQWDLGSIEGTRLTFTDGVALHGRWTGFVACAEASPDATRDGPVAGVVLGRLDDRERVAELAAIADEHGMPLTDKAEGIAFDETNHHRAWLVIDRDDPESPAELLELRLGDGWAT